MKNNFQVFGSVTVILLKHKGEPMTTVISTEDLNRVASIAGSWYVMDVGGKRGKKLYVGTKVGGVTVYLHQIVTMSPPRTVVDHYDHNTLNNLRDNLRVVSYVANGQNRRGAQRNNKSTGLRNVYRRKNGTFQVKLTVQGNVVHIGTFGSIIRANQAAIRARKLYFPYINEKLPVNTLSL